MSFGLIRGGHLDLTVLGGLQVDQSGLLANSWMISEQDGSRDGWGNGSRIGCKARYCRHATLGQRRSNRSVKRCTLPITSTRPVVYMVVTESAVITFEAGRAILRETGAWGIFRPNCLRRQKPNSLLRPMYPKFVVSQVTRITEVTIRPTTST